MSKKIFIFLIIFLIVLGFFNFRKTEEVEAVTTWFETTCSLSSNTWTCYNDVIFSCTATKCRNAGSYNCVKTCTSRSNATASSANCVLNPSSQSTMPCTCAGVGFCNGESGTCAITTNRCDYTCLANYENCDGNNANGCECQRPGPACGGTGNNTRYYNCNICDGTSCNTLVDAAHCLSQNCDNATHTQICSAGSCAACSAGFASCDLNSANGCEVDLNTDPNNCGSCGNSCGANTSCSAGSCVCNAGYANCDGNWANGCEANLNSDPNNCGTCGNICTAGKACINGECLTPNLYGFAWSENLGWISFNSKNCDTDGDGTMEVGEGTVGCPPVGTIIPAYGVYLPKGGTEQRFFKGYAWSANIGWIRFDPPDAASTDPLVTDCHNSPAYLLSGNEAGGLVRACAGAANTDCSGGANSAAGGWDGWICLQGVGAFSYRVTLPAPSYDEFRDWAWGGGGTSTNGTNAVVGWISFNCLNRGVCTAATAEGGPSNYKVTYEPENTAPTVSGMQLDGSPKYCNVGPGEGQISFGWTYTDTDTDNQSRFDFQVDNNSDFSSPEVNRRYCNLPAVSPPSPRTNTQTVSVKPTLTSTSQTYCAGTADELIVSTPDAITYNTSYYWRVRVFDNKGGDSGWVQYNDPADTNEDYPPGPPPGDGNPLTFTTIPHAKPWVDFRWCPSSPKTGKTIQFCSSSEAGVCEAAVAQCQLSPPQPLPENPVTCYGGASCSSWSWNLSGFTDWTFETSSDDTSQNPAGQFAIPGGKSVSLTVTDSSGFSCSKSHTVPVEITLPLPEWKEIPPTF